MNDDCVFCFRLQVEDAWFVVDETPFSVAAVANHQRSTGSLIVIPRHHEVAISDLSRDEALDLHRLIRRCVAAVRRAYSPDGMYVWQGGRIPAAHVHARICPRYAGVPYTFVPNAQLALTPRSERRAIADRIRGALTP